MTKQTRGAAALAALVAVVAGAAAASAQCLGATISDAATFGDGAQTFCAEREWVPVIDFLSTTHVLTAADYDSVNLGLGILRACSDPDLAFGDNGNDFLMRLTMGTYVDYFRPAEDSYNLCQVMQSRTNHAWANSIEDGAQFVKPGVYNNHYGGSARFWPQNNVPGDNREYINFWGGHNLAWSAGCCYNGGDTGGWGLLFQIDVMDTSPAEDCDTIPTLREGAGLSEIDDDELVITLDVSASRYSSVKFAFIDADDAAACDDPNGDGSGVAAWTVTDNGGDSGCENRHVFRRPVTAALDGCGFAGPADSLDGAFSVYSATVEVTTTEVTGEDVFGTPVTETVTSAVRVEVRLPKSVSVTSGDVDAFPGFTGLAPEAGALAAVTTQTFDVATNTATVTVRTAVAYPYVLEPRASDPLTETASGGAGVWSSLGNAESSAVAGCDAAGDKDAVCVQDFALTLAAGAGKCELDGTYRAFFTVRCSAQFGDGTGCTDNVLSPTAEFELVLESASFCAQVVEVAEVTPSIVTSTSQGGAQADDFVLQTTLHARVSVAAEGGVTVARTTLSGLKITSSCTTGCVAERDPFADGLAAAQATDGSGYSFVHVAAGSEAAETDFSFQLNTNSVGFDTGAGQAALTLTATVQVEYVAANLQRSVEEREVHVQLAPGPGSAAVAASTSVGISAGAGAGGGVGGGAGASSSTAGSTVLGVSTGTAMVAGVGLVAVVALAAGAVVAARKRRGGGGGARKANKSTIVQQQQQQPRVTASSSSASLELGVSGDLRTVQQAYDQTV